MPELYAGVQRANGGFPVQYLGANVPQAWAAGSAFMLVQSLLGIQADAPGDKLYVDPWLPDWLPEIDLIDLRVGKHVLDIHFARTGDGASFEVRKGNAAIVERRSMAQSMERMRNGPAA